MKAGNITDGLVALDGTGPALLGNCLLSTEDDIEVCCQLGTVESVILTPVLPGQKQEQLLRLVVCSVSLFTRPSCRSPHRSGPGKDFLASSLWPHAFLCSRW